MKVILAISGGMDSMLLLRIFSMSPEHEIVVAHFDHGMRPSSKEDAEFVRREAEALGVPFYLGEGHLGPDASEAEAREARYKFLDEMAEKEQGIVWTAHHVDDLVETIAINIARGTGWRGLAPFSRENAYRPFIESEQPFSKFDVRMFAARSEINFRQDPTNSDMRYLRNRIREQVDRWFSTEDYMMMLSLYKEQVILRTRIDNIARRLLPKDGRFERAWFKKHGRLGPGNDDVAMEVLRAGLVKAGVSATRPQIADFLEAIRTYEPKKKFNLPGGKLVTIDRDYFVI